MRRISFLPTLHSKQEVMRLSKVVLPPLENGTIWSTANFAPSWTVLPQYWQVKLSLCRISNRILSSGILLLGFCLRNILAAQQYFVPRIKPPFWPKCSHDIPADSKASRHEPKRFWYTKWPGNPVNPAISLLLGVWPSKFVASLILSIKYSFVSLYEPFFGPLFIINNYRAFNLKCQDS